MENKRQVSGSSSSSSSSLDDLFGPKVSSSSATSSTGLFGTIFPPSSVVLGRDSSHSGIRGSWNNQGLAHHGTYGNPDHTTEYSKGQSSGTRNKDKTHLSTMEAKKIILQGRKPPSLPNTSKRVGEMIQMETILMVVPQEEIGGRARFITSKHLNPKFISNTRFKEKKTRCMINLIIITMENKLVDITWQYSRYNYGKKD
ncbi:hypothetical protein GQ457_02G022550 [Hibiscus cannabinus]